MGQESFYRENRADRGEREVLLTERPAEDGGQMLWRIRPMSQRENEDIWKRCGEDEKRYEGAVLAESVVFPDLKDAALQNSYGVAGAERLLARLLLAGNMTACGWLWKRSMEVTVDVSTVSEAGEHTDPAACDTCGNSNENGESK